MPEYFSRDKGDNLPSVDKESEAQWLSVLTNLIVQKSQVPASFITGLPPAGFWVPSKGTGLWQEALAFLTAACSGCCRVQLLTQTCSLSFQQMLLVLFFNIIKDIIWSCKYLLKTSYSSF